MTDPGSPLHKAAVDAGYRNVFLADPNVGGRFSVLSAFGVVPSALAGVPVAELLDEAAARRRVLRRGQRGEPRARARRRHGGSVAATSSSSATPAPASSASRDWAEQLIAESTGKYGVGVLPVVAEVDAPDAGSRRRSRRALVSLERSIDGRRRRPGNGIIVAGTLGGQFLLWEYATSIAGRILDISPFDQPNVESAKVASRALLDALPEPEAPLFVDDGIEVRASAFRSTA